MLSQIYIFLEKYSHDQCQAAINNNNNNALFLYRLGRISDSTILSHVVPI